MRCEQCGWWVCVGKAEELLGGASKLDAGQCRRYPPTTVEGREAEFPFTAGDAFCGEFRSEDDGK